MQKLYSGLIFSVFAILLASPLHSEIFAVPSGDAGGDPEDLPGGPFSPGVLIDFIVEYDPTAGPIQKDFPNFPQLSTQTIMEEITVGAGSPDITDWHEEGGQIPAGGGNQIGNQRIDWLSATITLDDGSTCTVAQPSLSNTCGDITIMLSTSGFLNPQQNPIYDIVWFDFPNNPQSPGDIFTIQKDAFWPFSITGASFTLGVNEFPTSQPTLPTLPPGPRAPSDAIGGEIIPIESTALVLAGLQTSMIWMIPTLAGIAGAGLYLIKFRSRIE